MIALRLCSRALSIAWPLEAIPRNHASGWYSHRFGLMFGRALHRALQSGAPLAPESVLIARPSVQFTNPEQVQWAVHVAGLAAVIQGIPSDTAYSISSFVRGDAPFASVPPPLQALGVYSCLPGEHAVQFGTWLGHIDRSVLSEEARALHGAEWLPSLLAVVDDLRAVFLSTATHGADLCAWAA